MINIPKLRGRIAEAGYNNKQIAEKIGVHPATLCRKLEKGVFNSDEIQSLIKVLNIEDPMSIFFVN